MNASFSKNNLFITFFFLASFFCFLFFSTNITVFSDSLAEYEEKLEEKKQEKEEAESYLEYIQGEISRIQSSGYSVSQQISMMDEELQKVEEEVERVLKEIEERENYISAKEEELMQKQEEVNAISDRLYRNSRMSFLDVLLSAAHDHNMIHSLILNRFVIGSQVTHMKGIANDMVALNTEREELEDQKRIFEEEQSEFEESKALLAQQRAELQAELGRQVAQRGALTNRLGTLEGEISRLQEAILAAKSGSFVLSVGDVPATGNVMGTYQGFVDSAPTGSFGIFSIGAHTHRRGMSQWGAKARADFDGASYTDLLDVYYPETVSNSRTMDKIIVRTCHGNKDEDDCRRCDNPSDKSLDFETEYLYRIAEMPESWNLEALKAQAVAARSYALYITNNGAQPIRDDQCDQVIASEPKTGAWKQAVDQTRREVRTIGDGGPIANTEYSATTGGFVSFKGNILNILWDTKDGTDNNNWTSRAWESIAGSSWFYRAWYHLGSSSCDREPWLSNREMSDIINTWLVVERGEGRRVDSQRVLPVTIKECPIDDEDVPNAGPYSMNEMSSLLANPVINVNSVVSVVRNSNTGQTTNITFSTNRGNITIPAGEFHRIVALRAPGYIHIPQSGFTHIDVRMK